MDTDPAGAVTRLLIVDDEAPQLQALVDVLSREGYATRGCASAEEALELLGGETYDLLLSDLQMPGMDGIELIRRAVGADPDLVAVLMTGHGSVATAVEAMRTGAIDYVLKPFRLEAIRPVLARALEFRRLRQQNRLLQTSLMHRTGQLEAANRELDEFAGRVAHDLQAPLRHMLGFAEILQESCGATLPADDLGVLHRIIAAGHRGDELCRDLLAFARLGDKPVGRAPVALGAVLEEARRMVEQQAPGSGKVSWTFDALPTAMVDASLMQQVFVNLLSNAIKYGAGADPIRVEVRYRLDPRLGHVISVCDHGVGFDPAQAHRLFAPFERLHDARQFPGTGMGLANVKRIIERHGGTVRAESRPGEGATFYVSLPLQ